MKHLWSDELMNTGLTASAAVLGTESLCNSLQLLVSHYIYTTGTF
jgi:hypothetical protein